MASTQQVKMKAGSIHGFHRECALPSHTARLAGLLFSMGEEGISKTRAQGGVAIVPLRIAPAQVELPPAARLAGAGRLPDIVQQRHAQDFRSALERRLIGRLGLRELYDRGWQIRIRLGGSEAIQLRKARFILAPVRF